MKFVTLKNLLPKGRLCCIVTNEQRRLFCMCAFEDSKFFPVEFTREEIEELDEVPEWFWDKIKQEFKDEILEE